jgi:paraquat-inducible protein B
MSKKASPAAIGGFVLGAIALLIVGIVVFSGGKLFRDKREFVSHFPGTVAGLSVGAPVQFQGVQIGEVTSINLDYYADEKRFSIPVRYEIWHDALRRHRGTSETLPTASFEEAKEVFQGLVENEGLRATLTTGSLVTGQYLVSLELRPKTDFHYVGADPGVIEIPTIEATRDKLAGMLEGLDLKTLVAQATRTFEGINAIVDEPAMRALPQDVQKLISDARTLVGDLDNQLKTVSGRADATLTDYQTLAQTANSRVASLADSIEDAARKVAKLSSDVDAKLDPLAKSAGRTLGAAEKAAGELEEMLSSQSATRTNLDTMLEEAANAARSLRILADYLEQNPDALIKGKY